MSSSILDVRIVHLSPMRVASFRGEGETPEPIAWEKLVAWARPRGLLDDATGTRIFGFNDPNPSPGRPEYGYELWITVGPEVKVESEVRVVEFAGGVYAVTRCRGVDRIHATWRELARWLTDSRYQRASRQWLEEHFGDVDAPPDARSFDLHAPISE